LLDDVLDAGNVCYDELKRRSSLWGAEITTDSSFDTLKLRCVLCHHVDIRAMFALTTGIWISSDIEMVT
jgi:hypothetical protein